MEISRKNIAIGLAGLVGAGIALPGCSPAQEKEASFRPNILIISCEDISPYLGCYGDSVAKTPVLDKLASEGVRFTNTFSVAGVCAPSRFALITGMYPSSAGGNNMRTSAKYLTDGIPPHEAVPPAEVKCYSELMRAAGFYSTNNEKTDYQFTPPITAWDESSREAHWRNRPADQPFFSIFNIMTSHESMIWTRANDPVVIPPHWVIPPPYHPDDPIVRKDLARVYSNITIMDREVGDILAQLEADGLMDSTIIIFYSDHGGPMPRQKRELYDSGLKVPMIIRFPNKQHAGMVVDDLVSFVDIPPTVLALAGVKVPEWMQGQVFWGGNKTKPREYIYAARDRMDERYDMVRAVRDKRYKYIRNYQTDKPIYQDITFRRNGMASMKRILEMKDAGELDSIQMLWFKPTKAVEELYDTWNDPHEIHTLAGDPAHKETLETMRAMHEHWMNEIQDKGHLTEKELVWSMWPGGIQPITQSPEVNVDGNTVTMSCSTEGASIAYQVNDKGLDNKHWYLYTGPFEVQPDDQVTAVAIRIGFKQSEATKKTLAL